MQRNIANTVIGCLAFVAVVLGLTLNRILSPSILTNEQLSENGLFVYEVPRRISEFSLIDHHGDDFTREDLQGKWSLIFFGFTQCPDICPTTMASLNQFMQLMEGSGYQEDTQVVMVSVDPERDTPEKLADYVGFFGEDFIGATGQYIDIFNFASQVNIAFGYIPTENGNYDVNHSGEIVLMNPNGHFHGFFKIPHDPEKMQLTYTSVRETWR